MSDLTRRPLAALVRGAIVSAFAEVLAVAGARLVRCAGLADVIVEVRAATAAATDIHQTIGIPVISVVGRSLAAWRATRWIIRTAVARANPRAAVVASIW